MRTREFLCMGRRKSPTRKWQEHGKQSHVTPVLLKPQAPALCASAQCSFYQFSSDSTFMGIFDSYLQVRDAERTLLCQK